MTVKGVNELIQNLDKLRENFGDTMANNLYAAGEIVRGKAIDSIEEVSLGRTYATEFIMVKGKPTPTNKPRRGGPHTASKAGDAPNTDTGDLVKSIAVEAQSDGVYVGSNLKYAPWLEFGTKTIAARPWLVPAKLASQKKILQLIKKGLKKLTQKDMK